MVIAAVFFAFRGLPLSVQGKARRGHLGGTMYVSGQGMCVCVYGGSSLGKRDAKGEQDENQEALVCVLLLSCLLVFLLICLLVF